MDDPFRRPTVVPALFYGDPWAALDWLEKAFGFQRCDRRWIRRILVDVYHSR